MTENIEKLFKMAGSCVLCPRECRVSRKTGEKGFCKAGMDIEIASHNLHFGEEPPISGEKGSGTIFFSHCNLGCSFCQNYPISHYGHGKKISAEELVKIMLGLQAQGAHNINFVTPTHFTPQIAEAISESRKKGLSIPIVYNTGGYEKTETLKLLDGLVDIYMPDIKFGSGKISGLLAGAPDYFDAAQKAVLEMFRQAGHLVLDKSGIAVSGLLIRHLVLPENLSSTELVLDFISKNIGQAAYISLMSQYHPAHQAAGKGPLSRGLTKKEYDKALKYFHKLGFYNGYTQEL